MLVAGKDGDGVGDERCRRGELVIGEGYKNPFR